MSDLHPILGHSEHVQLYDTLGALSAEEFVNFCDPERHVCRLLIMHTLVLDVIMCRRVVEEQGPQGLVDTSRAMIKVWVKQIYEELPDSFQVYGRWPVEFVESLDFSSDMEQTFWKPMVEWDYNYVPADHRVVEV